MISGLKGSGVKDLTQYLMEQVYLIISRIGTNSFYVSLNFYILYFIQI